MKRAKKKKIPLRSCVGCRSTKPKQELIRIVRTLSGEVDVDVSGKAKGRGAYLCFDGSCFSEAEKRRALAKALDMSIDESKLRELEVDFSSCVKETKMVT